MLCGIDEAGRGCVAGPLVVAGVILKSKIIDLNDSKKLSEKKREVLFDKIIQNSIYHIAWVDNKTIDEKGLSYALKFAICEIMDNILATSYLMDGNTSFGIQNLQHKIKADTQIEEVMAASILAKVSRDRYMVEIAKKFTNYSFEKHKGYVTKLHKDEIREFGYCKLHRISYKINL